MIETDDQKRTYQRWSRLAIQLNGAAECGRFDHLTLDVILREVQGPDVFGFLVRELPASVWAIAKLTDKDRHLLAHAWRTAAEAYEPKQFHVSRNGLALLVAYILHLIDIGHTIIPT